MGRSSGSARESIAEYFENSLEEVSKLHGRFLDLIEVQNSLLARSSFF